MLIALIVAGLWPQPQPVEVAKVKRGDLAVTVNEEGMTRVKNRYVITSPVAGQLRRIEWKAGATVEAGKTVLAVLESGGADLLDARGQAQAEARVRAAEAMREQVAAQRASAAANAKMQRDDFARQQILFKAGTLSRQSSTRRSCAPRRPLRRSARRNLRSRWRSLNGRKHGPS